VYKWRTIRGPSWRKARAAYLKTMSGECEGCPDGPPATDVHRLHPIASDGDQYPFDNPMAVCGDCHKNTHLQLRVGVLWCCFEAEEWEKFRSINTKKSEEYYTLARARLGSQDDSPPVDEVY
jgi:hypothetical protein